MMLGRLATAADPILIVVDGVANGPVISPALLGAHLGSNFRAADWEASAQKRFPSCGLGVGALFRHFVANNAARSETIAGRMVASPTRDWLGHILASDHDRSDDEGALYRWMQTDVWQDLAYVERLHGENLMVVSGFPDLGKETAAALVAFCNGSPTDARPIGIDASGRDWLTIGHWAGMRARGDERHAAHPESYRVRYWEVGNELYDPRAGASAHPWLYIDGYDNSAPGRNNATRAGYFLDGRVLDGVRHEGFLAYRAAMKAVDPGILVGPMLAPEHRGAWYVDWNETILAKAKGACEFVSCHTYSRSKGLAPERIIEQPDEEVAIGLAAIRSRLAAHGYDASFPLLDTEWNAYEPSDFGLLRMQSALYDAQCIGLFIENGLAGSCFYGPYDTVRADGSWATMVRAAEAPHLRVPAGHRWPSYYAFSLWAGIGGRMSHAHVQGGKQGALRCYAAVATAGIPERRRFTALVLNLAGVAVTIRISVSGAHANHCVIDQVVPADGHLECADVVYDGVPMSSPAGERIDRLEDMPPLSDLTVAEATSEVALPGYSMTRIRFEER